MSTLIDKITNSRVVSTTLLLVGIFLLIKWGVNQYQNLKVDLKIATQNESALRDSLRVNKNKIGQLEFSKEIMVAKTASDIKSLNNELAKLAKNFNGQIHELTKIVSSIKSDTVFIDNTKIVQLPNGVKAFKWDYEKIFDENNYRIIAGETQFRFDSITNTLIPLGTLITKDEFKFNLVQGLRTRKDGKVEMFVTSNYPKLLISELNSVLISPSTHPSLAQFSKKNKFNLSAYSGLGGTINLSNSTMVFGPQLGFGISYSFW